MLRFRVSAALFSRFRGLRFLELGASRFGLRFQVLRFRNYPILPPCLEQTRSNHTHCLGPTCAKLYTLFRTDSFEIYTLFRTAEKMKTIPFPAAHLCIGHIREYPPGAKSLFDKQRDFNSTLLEVNKIQRSFYLGHTQCFTAMSSNVNRNLHEVVCKKLEK